MTFGRITAILSGIFAIVVALILLFPDLRWTLPYRASAEADGIDGLFRLMLIVSIGIFIFVQGFLLYFVWLYRRRPEDDEDATGRSLHGDNRLEIAWTIAPAIFLVFLTVLSLRVFEDLNLAEPIEGARIVDVTGRQFFWNFEHPATGISETGVLTLEEDVPVALNVTATDVIHAFWVPEFRVKQDATPGFIRTVNITPTEVGEYPLRCAEFCGTGHSQMLARVVVLDSEAYAAWEAEQLEAATAPEEAGPEAMAELGLSVYAANGCGACHQFTPVDSAGGVGPSHDNMGAIAAERIADPAYTGEAETPAEYVAESIRNPGAYIPPDYSNVMPAFTEEQISDDELEALVQLLLGAGE